MALLLGWFLPTGIAHAFRCSGFFIALDAVLARGVVVRREIEQFPQGFIGCLHSAGFACVDHQNGIS